METHLETSYLAGCLAGCLSQRSPRLLAGVGKGKGRRERRRREREGEKQETEGEGARDDGGEGRGFLLGFSLPYSLGVRRHCTFARINSNLLKHTSYKRHIHIGVDSTGAVDP